MILRLVIICSILIGFNTCGNRYGFDFSSDWDWSTLKKQSSDSKVIAQIDNLEKDLSIREAHFLFTQLSSLKHPIDIAQLSKIERDQNKSGGGYYGYIPDFFTNPDKIPLPENFNGIIACANFLVNIRKQIDIKISRSNFKYTKTFHKQKISAFHKEKSHPGIHIDINTDAVADVLLHYRDHNMTMKIAEDIANQPTFQQMLMNRKEIGYIPEPLPETDDLALFIYTAGCTDPVSMIWKWLNPWNYFGFADLYLHANTYYEIIEEINKNKEQFAANITARVGRYLPEDFEYCDQIGFGVNWGVLNWSTDTQLGINLAQYKNDYSSIYRIASRQLFRKIQSKILQKEYGIKTDNSIQIKDMIGGLYENIYDQFFYEVLTQILLEGTAAYIAGKEKSWIIADENKYGKELLNQIYYSLYKKVDLKTVEYCKSEGFGPNGPLVSIGYRMTKELVNRYGKMIIYESLKNHYLDFYIKYIEIEKDYGKRTFRLIDPHIAEKIHYLNSLQ